MVIDYITNTQRYFRESCKLQSDSRRNRHTTALTACNELDDNQEKKNKVNTFKENKLVEAEDREGKITQAKVS